MLRHYSIINRCVLALIIALTGAFLATSCEKFEKRSENSPFTLRIHAAQTAASKAELELVITEGSVKGDCTSVFELFDSTGRLYNDYNVYFADGSVVRSVSSWNFSEDGKMRFSVGALPVGVYRLVVSVRRWYHTASAECELIIE